MPTKKRMLVDASHPEETRIVVTSSNRLDEFDFEAANRRQLRGNIYLAKVTRVEPSLQAAFIEYGGNRHGFLAFPEIHPDYYQIPAADRQALLEAEAEAIKLEAELAAKAEENTKKAKTKKSTASKAKKAESIAEKADLADEDPKEEATASPENDAPEVETPEAALDENNPDEPASQSQGADEDDNSENDNEPEQSVDDLGGGEGEDLLETRRKQIRRYKIQEVIKRGQVLLVQVVKEERGNKGAALTTYLSLAGRYSVLMPNTARGGGISRKITSGSDRKRLKQIASELEVPQGMGVILRTAGASRTKAEIKRDFEYLSRLWENVRQLTMKSTAPSLVYEEGSLIKRTIRDLYTKDISEVIISGELAYKEAKDFMQLIMPSHAKNVKQHNKPQNLFSMHNVEAQLDSMFSPQVTLPSGGYIVINPTEALISIDVNSGRATKEHNIEATALQTNLEAAQECARQFRLRDLAGLIVIDFIDMNERRSTRAVEKRLKEALKNDRARIQIGRISHFGLLEMSRQRMRSGVLESSTNACPACEGTGIIRAAESRALMVLRAIEDQVVRKPNNSINVKAPAEVALYLLNAKRASLLDLEAKHKITINIEADGTKAASDFTIERGEYRGNNTPQAMIAPAIQSDQQPADDTAEQASERPQRKRRRRKSGDQTPKESSEQDTSVQDTSAQDTSVQDTSVQDTSAPDTGNNSTGASPDENLEQNDDEQPRKRRRRGRRGGRRNRRGANGEVNNDTANAQTSDETGSSEPAQIDEQQKTGEAAVEQSTDASHEPAKRPARRRSRKAAEPKDTSAEAGANTSEGDEKPKTAKAKPARKRAANSKQNAETAPEKDEEAQPKKPAKPMPDEGVIVSTSSNETEEAPKKKGWWGRW